MPSDLVIFNKTRYRTEDLEKIVLAALHRHPWRPDQLTVSYYSPSKSMKEQYQQLADTGLFVKALRNGDEGHSHKSLCITRPTRFDGVHELEVLAAAASNEAPEEVIQQIFWRMHLMARWKYNDSGPSWGCLCPTRSFRAGVSKMTAQHSLRLRFNKKDPAEDILKWRKEVVLVQKALRAAAIKRKGTQREVSHMESILVQTTKRLKDARKTEARNLVTEAGAQLELQNKLMERGGSDR